MVARSINYPWSPCCFSFFISGPPLWSWQLSPHPHLCGALRDFLCARNGNAIPFPGRVLLYWRLSEIVSFLL